MSQLLDNKQFANPTVGVELTVYFRKQSTDVDTATTKYMDLAVCKNFQIRSNKIFKVTKVNGVTLSDPLPSSTTTPEFKLNLSGTGSNVESVAFEADEASGDFHVLAVSGAQ